MARTQAVDTHGDKTTTQTHATAHTRNAQPARPGGLQCSVQERPWPRLTLRRREITRAAGSRRREWEGQVRQVSQTGDPVDGRSDEDAVAVVTVM